MRDPDPPADAASPDPFNLQRFVAAQEPVYAHVVAELTAGRKVGHWMWFIFPQIRGLGHSDLSRWYAIGSPDEALAYLRHPVLGPRLRQCTALVNAVDGSSARDIFGGIDAVKFRSSMTLFASVAPDEALFQAALDRYFDGEQDPMTVAKL